MESVRLPWGCWRILSLEDVPQGALIFHLDDELPANVRSAVQQELYWRLEALLVWAETELGQQGNDVQSVRKALEVVGCALDRLKEPARAAS